MPGRTQNSPDYRYGFNGKEKDEDGEMGSLTTYDYGFRIYNPGIGKFLSVDPLTSSFPWWTPYQFAGNTPIQATDLDGAEIQFIDYNSYYGTTQVLKTIDNWEVEQETILTGAFGCQCTITENVNFKDIGITWTFIHYENTWRLVPEDQLSQSINGFIDEKWESFLTLDQIDGSLDGLRTIGKTTETVVNIGQLADGVRNIASGLKKLKKQNSSTSQRRIDYENYGSDINEVIPNPIEVAKNRRKIQFNRFSTNWNSGSLNDALKRFVPGGKGKKSVDGVKTNYENNDYLIKFDNENKYFRVFDKNRKAYLDNNGNIPRTGSLKGKEAKNYLQKETHIIDDGT